MKRTSWVVVTAGFIVAAVLGYLVLRHWVKIEAHDLYIVGLVFLVLIFMLINRRLATSARELRAAARREPTSCWPRPARRKTNTGASLKTPPKVFFKLPPMAATSQLIRRWRVFTATRSRRTSFTR
jgi:hypothetical protein